MNAEDAVMFMVAQCEEAKKELEEYEEQYKEELEAYKSVVEFYKVAAKSIENQEVVHILPETYNGFISVHKCDCGALYIDEEFDGHCGKCGKRIKWKK